MIIKNLILFVAIGSVSLSFSWMAHSNKLTFTPTAVRPLAQARSAANPKVSQDIEMEKPPAGQYRQTSLGVHVSRVSESLGDQLDLLPRTGLLVEYVVANSAAELAGVRKHDVLLEMDDQILVNQEQLSVLVANHQPGQTVTLEIIRKGESIELETVLQSKAVKGHLAEQHFDAFHYYHGQPGRHELQNCSVCHAKSVDSIENANDYDNYKFFHGKEGPAEFQKCSSCHVQQVVPLKIKEAS